MSSQVPFEPVTDDALAMLTDDERASFERAAASFAIDVLPAPADIAELILTVHRFITAKPESEPAPAASDTAKHLGIVTAQRRIFLRQRDEARAERDKLLSLADSLERILLSWSRGMYAARIDCARGDVKAAIETLSEGLDGYDGTGWDGKESGAQWAERTRAEEDTRLRASAVPGGGKGSSDE